MARWKATFARKSSGKTVSPTTASHGSMSDHLHDAEDEHDDDAEGHRQRREDVPRRLDVGVGVGEQLARRVLVVPRERQAEVLPGDLAAVHRAEVEHRDTAGEPSPDDAGDGDEHDEREHRRRSSTALASR